MLASRRRIILGGPPGWVLRGASADLDFVSGRAFASSPSSFSALLSATRASTGYAQTAAGVLLPFSSNVARTTDQGLLVEEARTNLFLRSQDPSQWATKTNTVGAASAITGPDNVTNSAGSLADNSTNNAHLGGSEIAFTSGATYVFATILKAGTATVAQLTLSNTAFSGNGYANFNLATGAISQTGGTLVGSGISALTNGWYLCWIIATATSSATTTAAVGLVNNNATATRLPTYSGSGQTVYVWNADVQAGTFLTSPIITTASSATRAADVISLTGAAATAALAAKAARFETFGVTSVVTGGQNLRWVEFSGGALLLYDRSAETAIIQANSQSASSALTKAALSAGIVKVAFGMDASSMTVKAGASAQGSTANPWTQNTGTVYLGNRSAGDRALNGYMRRATFGPSKGQFDGLTV